MSAFVGYRGRQTNNQSVSGLDVLAQLVQPSSHHTTLHTNNAFNQSNVQRSQPYIEQPGHDQLNNQSKHKRQKVSSEHDSQPNKQNDSKRPSKQSQNSTSKRSRISDTSSDSESTDRSNNQSSESSDERSKKEPNKQRQSRIGTTSPMIYHRASNSSPSPSDQSNNQSDDHSANPSSDKAHQRRLKHRQIDATRRSRELVLTNGLTVLSGQRFEYQSAIPPVNQTVKQSLEQLRGQSIHALQSEESIQSTKPDRLTGLEIAIERFKHLIAHVDRLKEQNKRLISTLRNQANNHSSDPSSSKQIDRELVTNLYNQSDLDAISSMLDSVYDENPLDSSEESDLDDWSYMLLVNECIRSTEKQLANQRSRRQPNKQPSQLFGHDPRMFIHQTMPSQPTQHPSILTQIGPQPISHNASPSHLIMANNSPLQFFASQTQSEPHTSLSHYTFVMDSAALIRVRAYDARIIAMNECMSHRLSLSPPSRSVVGLVLEDVWNVISSIGWLQSTGQSSKQSVKQVSEASSPSDDQTIKSQRVLLTLNHVRCLPQTRRTHSEVRKVLTGEAEYGEVEWAIPSNVPNETSFRRCFVWCAPQEYLDKDCCLHFHLIALNNEPTLPEADEDTGRSEESTDSSEKVKVEAS